MVYLKFLILLVMSVPQAFIPLLHAHLGKDESPAALHLPGLERFCHLGKPGLDQSKLPAWEGVIVRSDDGIRRELQAGPTLAAVSPEPAPSLAKPKVQPAWPTPFQVPRSRPGLIILSRAPPA